MFVDETIVFVNTPTRRRLTVRAKPSDTIWDVKRKIDYENGIPVYDQVLKFEGQPLLNSYILPSSAVLTLDLEAKLYG